jgi:hypothetical protein
LATELDGFSLLVGLQEAAKKRLRDRCQKLRIFSKKLLTTAPWPGIIMDCSAR